MPIKVNKVEIAFREKNKVAVGSSSSIFYIATSHSAWKRCDALSLAKLPFDVGLLPVTPLLLFLKSYQQRFLHIKDGIEKKPASEHGLCCPCEI